MTRRSEDLFGDVWEPLDSAPGPAQPLSAEASRALVEGAMSKALLHGADGESVVDGKPRDSRRVVSLAARARRKTTPLLAAAVLFGATAAAAHGYQTGWLQPLVLRLTQPAPQPFEQPASVARQAPPTRVAPAVSEPVVADEPMPLETESERLPIAEKPAPSSAKRRAKRSQRKRTAKPTANHDAPLRDRLQQANTLRLERQYAAAADLYLDIVRQAPGSTEAGPARIAAATLLLEHLSQAGRAEKLFAEAERRGGALAPEAAFGVAEARRARGNLTAEREQLQALIGKYPHSTLASVARQRLSAAGDGSSP